MMCLEVIKKMNRRQKRIAKEEGLLPYIAKSNGDNGVFHCPNFGDYRPKGWKLKESYFVDSSGFGSEIEPALTIRGFLAVVKAGLGYAIIEEGQFQCYIGEFIQIAN
jgi:hypothetical protein